MGCSRSCALRRYVERRACGKVVHVEVAPGVVIVVAAWMLDSVPCAGMGFGAARAAISALVELHHLLIESGFRQRSRDDPAIGRTAGVVNSHHGIGCEALQVYINDATRLSEEEVTSKGLCQQERGAEALVLVFVVEDGEEDAVHRRAIGEDAHRPGSSSDFAKAPLDSICGPDFLALGHGFVAPAGQELVEIVAQAGDRFGIVLLPSGRRNGVPRSGPEAGSWHSSQPADRL